MHVSYVYTPIRYAWDLETYLAGSSLSAPSRLAARALRPLLRRWDVATAGRPDVIVAISEVVRDRIRRSWGREAHAVIHPPVDTAEILISDRDEGFLLVAARLLAYRRIDLAVAAATRSGRRLIVVGDGPERARLEAMAGSTVQFLGHIERGALLDLFARCHAYVVPGVEDFGIAPVEAMAAGKPVVALRAGGAVETVIEGRTGVFFDTPSADALQAALARLDGLALDRHAIRAQAERFDTTVFQARWRALLESLGQGRLLDSEP